jgi:hypothetical protein
MRQKKWPRCIREGIDFVVIIEMRNEPEIADDNINHNVVPRADPNCASNHRGAAAADYHYHFDNDDPAHRGSGASRN